MNIENIFAEWDADSVIDRTKLDSFSIEIPKLHNKYTKMLSMERLLLKKYESQYKQLKLEKTEFYIDGPTQDQIDKGWKLPPKGRILKSDAAMYIEADKDIIELSLKIGVQQEKVEILKSIVDIISRLGFQIKNSIDFMRFMNGS